jgi:colanic acid biosynthesis protein WcaH
MMNDDTFLDVIDATPLVSMDLLLEDKDGRVLLGKRMNKPAQGYWFVPGGRIRKNESLSDAIIRISMTELGIEITIDQVRLIGAFDHIYTDNFAGKEGVNTHYVAMGYQAKMIADLSIEPDDQHSDMIWWSKQELLNSDKVHKNTKLYFQDQK